MASRSLLTDFELMIVLAILRVGDDAYGARIARDIEAATGRRVLMGAAHAVLERLERNGLVTSRTGDPTPERGGRAKRHFAVTRLGVTAARDTQRALMTMWNGIPEFATKRR